MNTKDIGDRTVAMVMAALVKQGKVLLLPFGDNQRYDLALDDQGRLIRVQCKTGRLSRGAIVFNARSSYFHRGRGYRDYKQDADVFGVYCPATDKVYLVPVENASRSECSLRLDAPKNNQKRRTRQAADYVVS